MESQESQQNPDKAQRVIEKYLHNPQHAAELVELGLNNQVLQEAAMEIAVFNQDENHQLVKGLLSVLGGDEPIEGEDLEADYNARDGALELLKLVDYSQTDPLALSATFLEDLRKLSTNKDSAVALYSLMKGGVILAPHLLTKLQIGGAVEKICRVIADQFYDDRNKYMSIIRSYSQINSLLPNPPAELPEQPKTISPISRSQELPVVQSDVQESEVWHPRQKISKKDRNTRKQQRRLIDQAEAEKKALEIFNQNFEIQEDVESLKIQAEEFPWMKDDKEIRLDKIIFRQFGGRGCYFAECIESGILSDAADKMSDEYVEAAYDALFTNLPGFTSERHYLGNFKIVDNAKTIRPLYYADKKNMERLYFYEMRERVNNEPVIIVVARCNKTDQPRVLHTIADIQRREAKKLGRA